MNWYFCRWVKASTKSGQVGISCAGSPLLVYFIYLVATKNLHRAARTRAPSSKVHCCFQRRLQTTIQFCTKRGLWIFLSVQSLYEGIRVSKEGEMITKQCYMKTYLDSTIFSTFSLYHRFSEGKVNPILCLHPLRCNFISWVTKWLAVRNTLQYVKDPTVLSVSWAS